MTMREQNNTNVIHQTNGVVFWILIMVSVCIGILFQSTSIVYAAEYDSIEVTIAAPKIDTHPAYTVQSLRIRNGGTKKWTDMGTALVPKWYEGSDVQAKNCITTDNQYWYKPSKIYTCELEIWPEDGDTWKSTVTAKLNGNNVTGSNLEYNGPDQPVILTYTFPATEEIALDKSNAYILLGDYPYYYRGKFAAPGEITVKRQLKYEEEWITLTKDTDYELEITNNELRTSGTVKAILKNGYTGTLEKQFEFRMRGLGMDYETAILSGDSFVGGKLTCQLSGLPESCREEDLKYAWMYSRNGSDWLSMPTIESGNKNKQVTILTGTKGYYYKVQITATGHKGTITSNTVQIEGPAADEIDISKFFYGSVFISYIKDNFDTDHDGYLTPAERNAVKVINMNGLGAGSIGNLKYFTELEELYCDSNSLTGLDVSNNLKLKRLSCSNNSITVGTLVLKNNTELEYLNCSNCNLKSLYLVNNTKLTYLNCNNNKLTSLDLSKNVNLEILDCANNSLTNVSISRDAPFTNGINKDESCTISFVEHTHKFSGEWKYDADNHWHECTANDGAIDTKVPHAYDNDADKDCNECGYERSVSDQTTPGGTTPTPGDTTPGGTTPTPGTNPGNTQPTQPVVQPKITLNANSIVLKVKQTSSALKATDLIPGDRVISWKSSNKKVFTVNGAGKLKAGKKPGKAKLTITLQSGLTKTIPVKVQKGTVKTKKITAAKTVTLQKGQKFKLVPVLTPITTQEKVKYTSSKKKIATVNSKGQIIAKKKGKTVITITSGKKKAKCTIIVN